MSAGFEDGGGGPAPRSSEARSDAPTGETPATRPGDAAPGADDDAGTATAGAIDGVSFAAVDERSELERERDEYLDALRRVQADFENYRKRVDRQFEELAARGVATLVGRILPVLDTLDLAEDHLLAEPPGSGAVAAETKALVQARALLLDTLEKEGLERVGAAGEPFDPTVHDAVAHAEAQGGPTVDEVLRSGYRWRGQVLRPAMVKVRG
ncbi:MAG TPA: nucleotide exchange factor GrpE [Acidimicrobiales bacterium]|nr:nucleotide exchange factor GrpE [Acidimicrobiales bacterium]